MEDFTLINVQGYLGTIQMPFQYLGSHAFGSKAVLGQVLST